MQDDSVYDLVGNEEEDDGVDVWFITFADISMLLLVFFILLFSMSEIKTDLFTDSFTSVRKALGNDEDLSMASRMQTDEAVLLDSVRLQRELIEAQRAVYSEVTTYLNRQGVEGVVGSIFDEGVITLRVDSEVLFEPGSAHISPQGRDVIKGLMDVFIRQNDQHISIQGHTDADPPGPDSPYEDNWELSTMRAVSVLRILLEGGIEPVRLSATGMADMNPVRPNTSEANKAENRRVDFVLEKIVTR